MEDLNKKLRLLSYTFISLPLILTAMLFTAYYAYWNHGNQFAFLSLIYNKFLKLFNTADKPVTEWGVGALPPNVIFEDKVIFYFLMSACLMAVVMIIWGVFSYKHKAIKSSIAFNVSISLVVLFYGVKLLTNNSLVM